MAKEKEKETKSNTFFNNVELVIVQIFGRVNMHVIIQGLFFPHNFLSLFVQISWK